MSEIRQKSGKSLELAYLSGKSLEFEENCPELSLVNFPEHKTFILAFEIVKIFCSLRLQSNFSIVPFSNCIFIGLALEIALRKLF